MPSGATFSTISAAQRSGVHDASLQIPMNGRKRSVTASGSASRTLTGCSQKTRSKGVDMEGGLTIIRAQAPVAELGRYASQLRAMTGGHGNFTMEVSRYDVVPTLIQQRLSAERKPGEEKEE